MKRIREVHFGIALRPPFTLANTFGIRRFRCMPLL